MSLFSGKNKKIKHANTHTHTFTTKQDARNMVEDKFPNGRIVQPCLGSPGNVNSSKILEQNSLISIESLNRKLLKNECRLNRITTTVKDNH